jgi:hypothetical protein
LNTKDNNYVAVNVFGKQALNENDCVQRVERRVNNFEHFQADMEQTILQCVLPGKEEMTPKPGSRKIKTPTTSARKKTKATPKTISTKVQWTTHK